MGNFGYLYKKASIETINSYKKELVSLLNTVTNLLDKHNVKYSLDCGTLLGFYRDKKVIQNDGDTDLFIFGETITLEFLYELKSLGILRDNKNSQFQCIYDIERSFNKGAFIEPKLFKVEDSTKPFFSFKQPRHPSIDLFFYVPYYHERYCRFIRKSYVRFDRSLTDKLIDYEMQYGKYKIFENPENILRIYYNDNWNIPIDEFKDSDKVAKYGYYGMVERFQLGNITMNLKDMQFKDSSGDSIKNQKILGLLDNSKEYDNIFNLKDDIELKPDIQEWFKNTNDNLFKPFYNDIRRKMALYNMEHGSKRDKINNISTNWEFLDEKEQKLFKEFYEPKNNT